jgi:hypothetical protein
MNVVRQAPTRLEAAIMKLDERIDRLGGLPEYDQVPSALQGRDVVRLIKRIRVLVPDEVRPRNRATALGLLDAIDSTWAVALAASRPAEWANASDPAQGMVRQLADLLGAANDRPSVLKAT